MLIDVNAYLGHWAFRELRNNTAARLVRLMDRKGIDLAVVSSASAILYKNSQAGNEQLARDTRRHGDRLIPFAVINPAYADWEHDLAVCVEDLGMRGLRLYPGYHNYALADASC
ncbi:MAG: metal-dependent hydrolase, partial [Armatimonadota bacterium]